MEIKYKIECYKDNKLLKESKLVSKFPTYNITYPDTANYMIIYTYVKDINNNYVVIKKQYLTSEVLHLMKILLIKWDVKDYINKMLHSSSLYSNILTLKVGDKIIYDYHQYDISLINISRNSNNLIENIILELVDLRQDKRFKTALIDSDLHPSMLHLKVEKYV